MRVLVTMALGVFIPAASASVIGTLDVGSGGSLTVSLTAITFNLDPSSDPAGAPWNGEVASATGAPPNPLTFAGCPTGALGTAGCLDVAPDGPNEAVSINGNVPLTNSTILPENNFLVFAGNGGPHVVIDYTLTQVLAGSTNTNCAGLAQFASCSVFLGSPVVLTLEGAGTTATINFSGTVSDGAGTTNWMGKFSATFPSTTPAALQAFFCPGGVCAGSQSVTTSFAGTFSSSAVPEPYSMLLIGGGLIGLALLTRRKTKTRMEVTMNNLHLQLKFKLFSLNQK